MRREPYPHRGAKSVEISSRDIDGREVLLKENVTFSSKVNQRRDEDESCLEVQVPEALEKAAG